MRACVFGGWNWVFPSVCTEHKTTVARVAQSSIISCSRMRARSTVHATTAKPAFHKASGVMGDTYTPSLMFANCFSACACTGQLSRCMQARVFFRLCSGSDFRYFRGFHYFMWLCDCALRTSNSPKRNKRHPFRTHVALIGIIPLSQGSCSAE